MGLNEILEKQEFLLEKQELLSDSAEEEGLDFYYDFLEGKKLSTAQKVALGVAAVPTTPIALGAGILKAGIGLTFKLASLAVLLASFPTRFVAELFSTIADNTDNKFVRGLSNVTTAIFAVPTLALDVTSKAIDSLGNGLVFLPDLTCKLASIPALALVYNNLEDRGNQIVKKDYIDIIFKKVIKNIKLVDDAHDKDLKNINLSVENDNENEKTIVIATFLKDKKVEEIRFIYNGKSEGLDKGLSLSNKQKASKQAKYLDKEDILKVKNCLSKVPEKVEVCSGDETTEIDFPQNIIDNDKNINNMLY